MILETQNLNSPPFSIFFLHFFCLFLVNLISYLYLFIKFYKVLCYSKMTFEWLPILNPYVWPFSFFQSMTKPYFSFWSRVFPTIEMPNSSIEISGILALEALNSVLYLCVRTSSYLVVLLEETNKIIS